MSPRCPTISNSCCDLAPGLHTWRSLLLLHTIRCPFTTSPRQRWWQIGIGGRLSNQWMAAAIFTFLTQLEVLKLSNLIYQLILSRYIIFTGTTTVWPLPLLHLHLHWSLSIFMQTMKFCNWSWLSIIIYIYIYTHLSWYIQNYYPCIIIWALYNCTAWLLFNLCLQWLNKQRCFILIIAEYHLFWVGFLFFLYQHYISLCDLCICFFWRTSSRKLWH